MGNDQIRVTSQRSKPKSSPWFLTWILYLVVVLLLTEWNEKDWHTRRWKSVRQGNDVTMITWKRPWFFCACQSTSRSITNCETCLDNILLWWNRLNFIILSHASPFKFNTNIVTQIEMFSCGDLDSREFLTRESSQLWRNANHPHSFSFGSHLHKFVWLRSFSSRRVLSPAPFFPYFFSFSSTAE